MTGILLNENQQEAIEYEGKPLLIIAGAGTGKTTVITERIKYLILKKDISPSRILALTFTEKAAAEMEERIDIVMPYGYTQMWIATFHAFCDRILRSEALHIGLDPSYKLMNETESILFLRQNLFKFQLNYFRPLGNPTKFLSGMLQHFNRLQDEAITTDDFLQYAQDLEQKSKDIDPTDVEKTQELAKAYKTYEGLKAKEGVMDFADLITNTVKLFQNRSNVLKSYQEKFEHILIDEFQDTNFAQNQLALLLAGKKRHITVVGDDDQAIYRWRGAAIANMIQFTKEYKDAKIVILTKNYRSTREILNKSYTLIQHNNPDRLEVKEHIQKKLISVRNIKGDPVELLFAKRVEQEAELVIQKIRELTNKDYQYKDVAILVRANDHSQAFVRSLLRHNIPFQFLGPGQLFHQEEIKDLIAYLKVLYNFDDAASLYRVLHMPIFRLEARDIAALLNFARRKNLSLFQALEIACEAITQEKKDELFLKEDVKASLEKILRMMKRHLKLVHKETAGQILYFFLEDSDLLKSFLTVKSGEEETQYQNIAKFFEKLKTFEATHEVASVFAVVDWIDLAMQMGESPLATDTDWTNNNAVNILTVHSSKGLEFPVVFIVNLVSQRFPTRERNEQIPIPQDLIKEVLPEGDFHLQEERRLFYVAMTRAKDTLFFSAAQYYGEGKRERKISPFVYETLGEDTVNAYLIKEKGQTASQLSLLDWPHRGEQEEPKKNNDQKPVTPITYLSYSQIQTFDICPLHYRLRYILKIPAPQTAAQSFGTTVHSILRDFYQMWISGEKVPLTNIQDLLEKNWINEGYGSKEHETIAKEKTLTLIRKYLKKYFDKSHLPLALELPFQFTIDRLKVGGRIDRIDKVDNNRIEIIDYKTGNNVPSKKDLVTNPQLTFYALAATNVSDPLLSKKPEEVLLSLYYIEEDKKVTTVRTKEQLMEAKKQILAKAAEIERSDFMCSGSSLCKTCEYKILCNVHS